MTNRTDHDLGRRVQDLEQRLVRSSRLQRGLVVLLVLQLGLAASEQDSDIPEVVRTRALEVLGPEGKPVVMIGSDQDGNGGLAIYDRHSRPLVSLEADIRGAGAVNVVDPEHPTSSAAFLGVDAHGDGLAGVRSAREQGGASFGIGVHGAGEFAIYNPDGRRVGTLGGDAHGAGRMRLSDAEQRATVQLGRTERSSGEILVFDESGRPRKVDEE